MTRQKRSLLFALSAFALAIVGLYAADHHAAERQRQDLAEREEKRLFHFGPIHVQSFRWVTATGTTTARKTDGAWRIASPAKWPGDGALIHRLLSQLAALPSAGRIGDADANAERLRPDHGLSPPLVRFSVESERGVFTLAIGAENPLVAQRAVAKNGELHWVPSDLLGPFLEAPSVVLSRRVFGERKARDVQRLRIERAVPPRVIELQREGDDWRIQAGPHAGARAHRTAVDRAVVGLVQRFRATRWVDLAFTPTDEEWNPPDARIQIDDAPPVRVRLGDPALAHPEGTTLLLEAPKWLAETLSALTSDLRDRSLCRFDAPAATRVALALRPDQVSTIERGPSGWTVDGQSVPPWRMDRFLGWLRHLDGDRVHRRGASERELRDWWLAPASQWVTVYEKDRVLCDLALGKAATKDHRFVRQRNAAPGADGSVLTIHSEALRAWPEKIEDLVR